MTKILVIEDNDLLRQNLVDSLEVSNFEVISTADSFQGLRFAHETEPDLIICDDDLPIFTGNEVIKALRHNQKTSQIPIILIVEEPVLGYFLLRMGVNEYIPKSELNAKKILTTIHFLLNHQSLMCI